MKNKVIQVFEYETLRVGEKDFTEVHFHKLVKLNERHKNKYFKIGYNKIYFAQYVGLIQIGRVIIEILPKADNGDGDKLKWQKAFLYMLKESKLLKVSSLTRADSKLRSSTILELFYEEFITEVEKLFHTGFVKKYRFIEENTNSLKGKLLFNENIKSNLIHKEKFYNRFQLYDKNNIYNQIIKSAISVLVDTNYSPSLNSRIRNLESLLDQIERIHVDESTFYSLTYDRKTISYKKAITLAKMILLNYTPDITSGHEDVISLLFDMNEVFEKFIYYQIKKSIPLYERISLTVTPQKKKGFWGDKSIRPDIVIEYIEDNTKKRCIVDTKWKVLSDYKPSDDDLKQIYTYNIHYGSNKGVLLYPKVIEFASSEEHYHISEGVKAEYEAHSCYPYFCELFDEDENVRKNVGEIILNNLIEN